jgi:uncharacterized protein YjeT (DUF2065 family)
MADLWAAMCLVLVLEGLVLFAAPGAWKRAIAQLLELPEPTLRRAGGVLLGLGLLSLYFVRS